MARMAPLVKDGPRSFASAPFKSCLPSLHFAFPRCTVSLLNRLETRIGHWAVPGLTNYIAFGSGLTYLLWKVRPDFIGALLLLPANILQGEVWRLFTYMFVPKVCSLLPMPEWLNAAFHVLFLIWIGRGLDQAWGAFRTNVFCLLSWLSITVAAFFFGANYAQLLWAESLFFAYAWFYADETILFYFFPVKIRWLAWGLAIWITFSALGRGAAYQAMVVAVFFNYFLFFARDIFATARLQHQIGQRRAKFDREVRSTADEAMHRCHVCGRTEQTTPDLDFRVAADGEEYCAEHLPKKS